MTLRDEVQPYLRTQGPKCKLGILLRSLDKPTAKELAELLDGDDINSASLARFLTARFDVKVRSEAVRDHRNRVCSCSATPIRQGGR